MTKIEQLHKRVIEVIHGFSYDDALRKLTFEQLTAPCTIGRLLNAMQKGTDNLSADTYREGLEMLIDDWKYLREDKSEATLEDQTKKMIGALYQLLCTEDDHD